MSMPPSLDGFGSGNFRTPCERMQAAYASACRSCFVCSAGVVLPPFGSRFLQAFSADLNLGERASIPFSDPTESLKPLPAGCGSGKFGTPFLRMQAENATRAPRFDSFVEPVEPEPVVVACVEPTCATPSPDEPPQAEANRARTTIPARADAGRPVRISRDRPPKDRK